MENKINVVDLDTWNQQIPTEEEELDEFGNPINSNPVDLFSQGRRNLDETVEEREARQEDELVLKREETNRDRYVYDNNGQVVLDENTGQPVLSELSSFEKMANSFGNMVDQIQQAIPNASLGVNSLVRKVLGDETIDNFLANEDVPQFFKDFGTMTTEEADEALQQQQLQEAEMQETGSITEGLKNFDLGELAAGLVNGFTSIGSSAFTSTLSGGTSLIPEMIGRSYVDYNEALAEKEGKSLNQYMEETDGGENTWTSIAIGVGGGLLERAGLKGAGKYMVNKLVSSGLNKTFSSVLLSGNKEGLTELAQTGLEAVNIAAAKGENKTEAFVDAIFSQDGLESYLQGFAGGGLMRGGPRFDDKEQNVKFKKATTALRGPAETVLQNQALENISELRKTLSTTKDPQVKKEIKQGIAIQEAKIIDITLKAQAKAARLTDKQINQVAGIQDEVNSINDGVTELDQKLTDGVINTEQRNAAVKTYEEQFIAKQEELSEVVTNEVGPIQQFSAFTADESSRLVNLYNDLDKAIVNGDTDLESEINSKIIKSEQALKTTEEIIAEDSIVLSEKAQDLYDERGVDAVNSIVETQEGTIRSIAIKKLNSVPQFRRYDGDVDALASELRYGPEGVAKLVETYKPESGVPIAAYIAQQLDRRVQRAASKVLSQDNNVDFNSAEAANLLVEDQNDFEVKIGSRFLADQLKLPMSLVDKAKNIIPAGLQKAVNELQENKDLTAKKRQALAEQAVASIYDNQLVKDIKAEFGKNTKTKEDFSNYLNRNYIPLATAFVAQKAGQKGTGISKQWAMFPPTRSEFVDYYEGKDIPLDRKSRKSVISDRKAALAEAVSNQIAEDVRSEYLSANPTEAKEINKAANENVDADKKIVIANAINNSNIKGKRKEAVEKAISRDMPIKEKIEKTEKLIQSMELTLAEKFNVSEKETKKDLASYRTQNRENSQITIDFLTEKLLPKLGPKTAQFLKPSLSMGSRTRAFFSPEKYTDENGISIGLQKYIDDLGVVDGVSTYMRQHLTKTPVRRVLSIKEKSLSFKGQAEALVNSTAKAIDRIFTKEYQKEIDSKRAFFKDIVTSLNEIYQQEPTKENLLSISAFLATQSEGMTHFIRTMSPFLHYPSPNLINTNDVAWYDGRTLVGIGLDKKGNPKSIDGNNISSLNLTPKILEEEHTFKAGSTARAVLSMIADNTVDQNLDPLVEAMTQTALFIKDNETLNSTPGLKAGMTDTFHFLSADGYLEAVKIYAEANGKFGKIDLNRYNSYDKKGSIAERLNAASGNTIDEVSASNEVIKENSEEVNRVIASAVENKYNEPANNKLSNEQAVDALGDIFMANWNRDGNTNLNFVSDPAVIEKILMDDGKTEKQAKSDVENNHGFRYGNDLFVNLSAKNGLETLLHEAGHLWNSIVGKASPEVWNALVNKAKESGLFAEYYQKVKDNGSYAAIIEQYENGDTFRLEDEIIARIMEDYSAKKGFKTGNSIDKIKEFVKKYFVDLANILGFDPTTKNLADLTINEMIELAVSEVVTGDPLANFSRLKDSEGKTWFRKMKANVDPQYKASIDVEYQALQVLKEFYQNNGKNLVDAISQAYTVTGINKIMSLEEFSDFVAKTVSETKVGETAAEKRLAVAKKDAIINERARLKKVDALKETGNYVEEDQYKTSEELDKRLEEVQNEAIEKEKAKAEGQGEGLNRNFRKILNSITGRLGKPSRWFIPPNAEDIKGLLYAFLPGGEAGVIAKKFFQSTILGPYSRGVAAAEAEILAKTKQFAEMMKNFKSDLKEVVDGTPYSKGQAIKVYNWIKNGVEVDIEKQSYIDALVEAVENNPELKALADEIEQNFPIEYKSTWRNDTTINKSIYDSINSGTRAKHLETFAENVDNIFNKDNMQEIENLYGKKFRQALQNSLQRMKTGRNRVSTDAQSNAFLNWINRAVATTMFVNTRSAVLQLLSSLNFIGKANNNIFQATGAMFSGSWKKDFNTLWNSDYLKNRREGAKFDVLADEMSEGDVTGLNKILKFGFLPTRLADSFAIALGGASFYRNTVKALMANGISEADAKVEAMNQWQGAAEESQQSSDPSKISEIQSSTIGKVIYAFANTPFQYARIVKRKLQDVVSGRSAAEGGGNQIRQDLQSVLYYSVGQAMLFNALQTALFAVAFEDDEDEKEKLMDAKTIMSVERALTSYAKSLGNPGAVVGAIYSVIAEAKEQQEKYGKIDNPYKIALEATAISPPLNTKLKDIVAIGNIYKYNEKEIKNNPFKFSPDNKALEIVGNAASFVGVPLDRVIRKAQNLSAIANEESEAWQKLFLALGWSKWELGLQQNKSNNKNFNKSFNKNFNKKFNTPFNKTVLNKNLPKNVLGRANNDGTIEVDPSLKGKEKKKVIAHEKKHMQDMKSGKLNYDDNFVYWKGNKHARKNGKIQYNNKSLIEGSPKLPWEADANKAERSI